MYNENGTKIMVYNIKGVQRGEDWKIVRKKSLRKTTPEGKTPDTWLYYSG